MVERCVRDGSGKKKTRVSFSQTLYGRHPIVTSRMAMAESRCQREAVAGSCDFCVQTTYNSIFFEMWLSLVERCVRDAEVAGSNPVISTKKTPIQLNGSFFIHQTVLDPHRSHGGQPRSHQQRKALPRVALESDCNGTP